MSDGWTEIRDESQIQMEAVGDEFTYLYLGQDVTVAGDGREIPQGHFEDPANGERLFMNLPVRLVSQLKDVPVKSLVNVVWSDTITSGNGREVRVFKVRHKEA